jgi:thiol-disulfide isomerase/thioredoxin
MDEDPRRASRRRHLLIGVVAGLAGLLAATGAATAVSALGNDHGPDADIHFTADDLDGAPATAPTTTANPLVAKAMTGTAMPATQFELLGGGLGSLRDHAGTPMVVNLWYSRCVPCRTEMPALQSVHQQLGDRIAFVGLAVRDSPGAARDFVQETGVTYDIGLDRTGSLATDLGVVTFPTTYLVDGHGEIVATHAGKLTAPQLQKLIAEHLS